MIAVLVASAAKVRLACHPHDPYTPPGYRGVTRVLGTVEGLKRFVQMHESPYHGLNFCQGTVAEMLDDPAREIFDVIRWFGERGKIFNVHFRNIKGKKLDFMEAFPDEGDMDMPRSLAAYRDVDYPYMLMPDHVPQIDGRDPPASPSPIATATSRPSWTLWRRVRIVSHRVGDPAQRGGAIAKPKRPAARPSRLSRVHKPAPAVRLTDASR
jgi:D-mannonate dehydratase